MNTFKKYLSIIQEMKVMPGLIRKKTEYGKKKIELKITDNKKAVITPFLYKPTNKKQQGNAKIFQVEILNDKGEIIVDNGLYETDFYKNKEYVEKHKAKLSKQISEKDFSIIKTVIEKLKKSNYENNFNIEEEDIEKTKDGWDDVPKYSPEDEWYSGPA